MGMMQEFREFAVKGNVIDLAVGVIIGAAFGKIVDSVVADLIMPVVGLVFGKLDFSNLFVVLGTPPAGTAMTLDALRKAGVPVFAYGNFLTVAVNFIILAFIIFMMIKQVNRLKREAPAAVAARAQGLDVTGPLAPDTVFMRARHAPGHPGEFDVVLAMYHDQGLIPVKYLGVDKGVNVTLGLPLVRTSPDHGTAFDIAGQGVADAASLIEAVRVARKLSQ